MACSWQHCTRLLEYASNCARCQPGLSAWRLMASSSFSRHYVSRCCQIVWHDIFHSHQVSPVSDAWQWQQRAGRELRQAVRAFYVLPARKLVACQPNRHWMSRLCCVFMALPAAGHLAAPLGARCGQGQPRPPLGLVAASSHAPPASAAGEACRLAWSLLPHRQPMAAPRWWSPAGPEARHGMSDQGGLPPFWCVHAP